jgi:hypothetical protein
MPRKTSEKLKLAQTREYTWPFSRGEWMIAVSLGLLAILLIMAIATWQGQELSVRSIGGRWFQSDGWRVFDDMVDFKSNHYRNTLRPLFSLISMPLTLLIKHVLHLRNIQAIWTFNALCMAIWSGMIFFTLRLVGLSRTGAIAISLLGMISGAALFWFTVPETYALSSLSIIFCLFLAAYGTRYEISDLCLVFAGAFCLGTLLTNWMASLALIFAYRRPRKAISIVLASLLVVLLSWGLQKVVFPQPASLFLKLKPSSEKEYILNKEQGNPLFSLNTIFISSVVVPRIDEYEIGIQPTGKRLTIQRSGLFNSGGFYLILSIVWLLAIILGIIKILKTSHLNRFSLVILATLSGQVILHTIYGEETFLYGLHFATLLVVLAGASLMSLPLSRHSILAWIIVILIAVNNLDRLQTATKTTNSNQYDERFSRLKN